MTRLPIHPTEQIAREMVEGLQTQLDQLITPANDNNRAAWESAAQTAREISYAAQIVADAIARRAYMTTTGQDVTRATVVEVGNRNAAALADGFDQILRMVRPA